MLVALALLLRRAERLLLEAAGLYDDPELPLQAASQTARDFKSGAEWMRLALQVLRGQPPAGTANFQLLGAVKYGACLLAFLATVKLSLVLAVLAFYAVEAQMVFLFPLALDQRPYRENLRLTRKAGGTLRTMRTVMRLAVTMIFGGLKDGRLVRAWCLGCLAVVLWYEECSS